MINYNTLTSETPVKNDNDNEFFARLSVQEFLASQDMFSKDEAIEIIRKHIEIIA